MWNLGVAGSYLTDKQEDTIRALIEAWRLLGGVSTGLDRLVKQFGLPSQTARMTGNSLAKGFGMTSSLFSINRQSVENSLVQVLNIFGRFEDCVGLTLELLELPDIRNGGGNILLFSLVDWSDSRFLLLDLSTSSPTFNFNHILTNLF